MSEAAHLLPYSKALTQLPLLAVRSHSYCKAEPEFEHLKLVSTPLSPDWHPSHLLVDLVFTHIQNMSNCLVLNGL